TGHPTGRAPCRTERSLEYLRQNAGHHLCFQTETSRNHRTSGAMNNAGYYRCPTINGETVIFVCEDDLWSINIDQRDANARRLTAGRGECSMPRFSPDGSMLAFTGREEWHPEVYVMPADGGTAKRLT